MVSLGTQPANRKSGFGHSSPTGARAQDLSRQPARPDLWGARVSNDPGLPDRAPGHGGPELPWSFTTEAGYMTAPDLVAVCIRHSLDLPGGVHICLLRQDLSGPDWFDDVHGRRLASSSLSGIFYPRPSVVEPRPKSRDG